MRVGHSVALPCSTRKGQLVSEFFANHEETLTAATEAIATRAYYSAYPEHPKAYGEEAPDAGQRGFDALLGTAFDTGQETSSYVTVPESSPYGLPLDITYPNLSVDDAIARALLDQRGERRDAVRVGDERLEAESIEAEVGAAARDPHVVVVIGGAA